MAKISQSSNLINPPQEHIVLIQAHLENGILGVNVQLDVVEVQGTEYVIVKVVRPTAKRKHDLATPKIVYPNLKSEV